jgi:hypothetical protein
MQKCIRISLVLTIAGLLGACNFSLGAKATVSSPTATITSTSTPTTGSIPVTATGTISAVTAVFTGSPPGEPPASIGSWLTDPMTPAKAKDGYAIAGDDFAHNLFERPLDTALAYQPDIDILGATLTLDSQWLYINIQLNGTGAGKETLDANYGVELDVNLDGRGDFVIWAQPPFTTTWSRDTLTVYGTSTNMVGGTRPLLSDAPWKGETYNKILFDVKTSPDMNAAWVRVSPKDPKILQIAFSPEIVQKPARFLWGAWADDGIKDPKLFDYNDVFTKPEAGSPYKWDPEYPPKAILAVDNTCRAPYGFKPNGSLPGLCESQPTPGPTTKGLTPTQTLIPGPD